MSSCCGKSDTSKKTVPLTDAAPVAPSCSNTPNTPSDSVAPNQQPSTTPRACCSSEPALAAVSAKADEAGCCPPPAQVDYMLWGAMAVVAVFYPLHWLVSGGQFAAFSHAVFELSNSMAWGVVLGILMVAILAKVPREFVMSVMGTHAGFRGLLRATGAGLLLDLCSHGILMVGAKLYERGATLGQVMAFLIASPWNSFSLTLVLVALIGLKWTLTYIVLSALVALLTGSLFDLLVKKGSLPGNPNQQDLPEDFQFWREAKQQFAGITLSWPVVANFCTDGVRESRMVIRWLLVGIILAALIRVFVPEDVFGSYFGPTLLGLGVTLSVATVLEVCSEGSAPIAADIFNRAFAPGNSFAFLMTGVATDYTEIMVLKDTTRSWKIALFLPLLTVPQVVVLAIILNLAG